MAGSLPPSRRIATAAMWPIGLALTSWNYMWRTTPMRRWEEDGSAEDAPPALSDDVSRDGLQLPLDGVGPFFHRRYRVQISGSTHSPEEVIRIVGSDLNAAAPSEFARFFKLHGDATMRPGDEYLVRMPGPWDGPVRVVEVTPRSFRFVTLAGHLEAGQIEFSAERDRDLVFQIESWARSADRVYDLLYQRLRMGKEVQLHMWMSFLEGVAKLAGGKRQGRIEIATRRVADPPRQWLG